MMSDENKNGAAMLAAPGMLLHDSMRSDGDGPMSGK